MTTRTLSLESRPRLDDRKSGVLLHLSSLPGGHGIGDMGPGAERFADWLQRAGQSWWQMFPLGPVGYGNSPYQTLSVFAGNPFLISLERLAEAGYLSRSDLRGARPPSGRVDYDAVRRFKRRRFLRAFDRFEAKARPADKAAFASFVRRNRFWIDDYALFRTLSEERNRKPWWEWEPAVRDRQPAAMAAVRRGRARDIRFHQFLQYVFFTQWDRFKSVCAQRGVGIIGDAPIFVAHDSADVWAHRDLFHLDRGGRPTISAGVPPDYFSRTGQLWGNPLYRWDRLRRQDYRWWVERFRQAFRLFDAVRLDHFIGFHNFWAIPAGAITAVHGRWRRGPGAHFFNRVMALLGPCQFIAEDLGEVTPAVRALRDRFDFPGMSVLQFAFGDDREAGHFIPHNHRRRSVAYTGTHDNDTSVGWFRDGGAAGGPRSAAQAEAERRHAMAYLPSDGREPHWDMIRGALSSRADTTIIPMQDILGLGSNARMNRPGTSRGNWEWRLRFGRPTAAHARRLRRLTDIFGRLSVANNESSDRS